MGYYSLCEESWILVAEGDTFLWMFLAEWCVVWGCRDVDAWCSGVVLSGVMWEYFSMWDVVGVVIGDVVVSGGGV